MKSNFLPSIARQLTACAATLLIAATTVAAKPSTWIYAFKGGNDGSYPTAGLISDAHGNLYGTTTGSNFGGGTIFQLTKPTGGAWTETVLHTFTGGTTDGRAPEAGLIFDRAGNLYGTTAYGGTSNLGIVFELTPPPPAAAPGPRPSSIISNPLAATAMDRWAEASSSKAKLSMAPPSGAVCITMGTSMPWPRIPRTSGI